MASSEAPGVSPCGLIRRLDMGTTAHSDDLRSRVVAEVLAGASRRQAAERFKVSAASAVRWAQLHGRTGGVDPRPRGGKSRSPLEATFGLAAGFDHRGTGPDTGSDRAEALGRSWAEDFGGRGSSLLQAARDHLQKNAARRRTGPARRIPGSRTLEGKPGEP